MEDQLLIDRLFIQEIINSMAKTHRGFNPNSNKHSCLLRDWSRELREKTFTQGRTKKLFIKIVGKQNW